MLHSGALTTEVLCSLVAEALGAGLRGWGQSSQTPPGPLCHPPLPTPAPAGPGNLPWVLGIQWGPRCLGLPGKKKSKPWMEQSWAGGDSRGTGLGTLTWRPFCPGSPGSPMLPLAP